MRILLIVIPVSFTTEVFRHGKEAHSMFQMIKEIGEEENWDYLLERGELP